MYHLVNYPGIQTGVEYAMTPVMWGGVALIGAAAVLLAVYGVKKKKRKVRRNRNRTS